MDQNKLKQLTDKTLRQLGRNVRELRKDRGWTQEVFAEAANINDKEVSHIESGNRNITIETLIKISVALQVDTTQLIN